MSYIRVSPNGDARQMANTRMDIFVSYARARESQWEARQFFTTASILPRAVEYFPRPVLRSG